MTFALIPLYPYNPLFSIIHLSLAPNYTFKDIKTALTALFCPWKWQTGSHIQEFTDQFKKYLGVKYAYCFSSGRSALLIALQALGIKAGDEVLLQAFTCVVVPNAVIFTGAKPVYVDINPETYNLDPADLEHKITPQTKAIIIQNTFGIPADYDAIRSIAEKHHLKIIEDCAHSLGSKYHGEKLGTFGDIAIFSLGRDKVISAIHGGVATTNQPKIGEALKNLHDNLPLTPKKRIFQHLIHPLLFSIAKPLYNFFHLGKVLILSAQKLHLVSKVLEPGEKKSQPPQNEPAKLANILAKIGINQLTHLKSFNEHRNHVVRFYREKLKSPAYLFPVEQKNTHPNYLRFPLQTANRDLLLQTARKKRIYLDDWYSPVIAPKGTDLAAAQYVIGTCPVAEAVSKKVINLPTHHQVNLRQIVLIIDFLSKFDNTTPTTL